MIYVERAADLSISRRATRGVWRKDLAWVRQLHRKETVSDGFLEILRVPFRMPKGAAGQDDFFEIAIGVNSHTDLTWKKRICTPFSA